MPIVHELFPGNRNKHGLLALNREVTAGERSAHERVQQSKQKSFPHTRGHWTPRRKAEVVEAVTRGRLSLETACKIYEMTVEEFVGWQSALDASGLAGLRMIAMQKRRRPDKHSKRY